MQHAFGDCASITPLPFASMLEAHHNTHTQPNCPSANHECTMGVRGGGVCGVAVAAAAAACTTAAAEEVAPGADDDGGGVVAALPALPLPCRATVSPTAAPATCHRRCAVLCVRRARRASRARRARKTAAEPSAPPAATRSTARYGGVSATKSHTMRPQSTCLAA